MLRPDRQPKKPTAAFQKIPEFLHVHALLDVILHDNYYVSVWTNGFGTMLESPIWTNGFGTMLEFENTTI